MFELAALGLYCAQWLGVALGVGAQTVLLLAHLLERHESKHPWLGFAPGARAAQAAGLFLMVASGAGAVLLHLYLRNLDTLLQPAFGFKWMLIVFLYAAYRLERQEPGRLAAVVEGFAGATWYALFIVHSLAPVTSWANLFVLYVLWLAAFAIAWSAFVLLMNYASKEPRPILKATVAAPKAEAIPPPKPKVAPPQPKPLPPPEPKPAAPISQPHPLPAPPSPAPTPKPAPTPALAPKMPRISIWAQLRRLFARKKKIVVPAPSLPQPAKAAAPAIAPTPPPKAPQPAPAVVHAPIVVSFPVPPKAPVATAMHPPNIPSAPLRFDAPKPAPAPVAVQKSAPAKIEKPKEPAVDYMQLPALQVMPQKPEELSTRNRGPLVSAEVETLESRSAAAARDLHAV